MNVVFLLLSTAVGAGDAPAGNKPAEKKPPENKPAVVAAAPAACTGTCGAVSDCCDKPGLFDRLRGKFRRGNDCCDSAPRQGLCGGKGSGCFGSGGGLLNRFGKKSDAGCCGATTTAAPACCDPCGKPGLFDRLRGKFRKGDDCCASSCGGAAPAIIQGGKVIEQGKQHGHAIIPGAIPPGTLTTTPGGAPIQAQPNEPRQKLPGTEIKTQPSDAPKPTGKPAVTTTPVLTPTAATVETEPKLPFDSGRRHDLRAARAADFSSLTGRLTFVRADGGLWLLRYAPLSTEDGNGGSVILANDARMKHYREGDVIAVEGRIIAARGSRKLAAPLYHAHSLRLVERPRD